MAEPRKYAAIAEAVMKIAYSKVQIKRTFFHVRLPLHVLTVITLEPITSCPGALP